MVALLKLLLLFAFSDQLGKMITCTCNMKGKIVIFCNSHIVGKFHLGHFRHPMHWKVFWYTRTLTPYAIVSDFLCPAFIVPSA